MNKKALSIITILSILLMSISGVSAITEPDANITPAGSVSYSIVSTTPSDWNSSYGYYLLQGYNNSISCDTNTSGGAAGFFWYYNDSSYTYQNTNMTKNSSTNFSCTFNPNSSYFNPGINNSTPCYAAPKKLYYQILNSSMNASAIKKIGCAVTSGNLQSFTSVDSGFYFSGAASNPIYGPATGTSPVNHGTANTYNV